MTIVATPAAGTTNAAAAQVTRSVGAATTGAVAGLVNGVTYNLAVFAKTGVASRAEMVAELFGGLHVPLED